MAGVWQLSFLMHLAVLVTWTHSNYPMPANFSDIKRNLVPACNPRIQACSSSIPTCGDGSCICRGKSVNCSYTKLDYVPSLPRDTKELYFSANRLHVIKRHDFFQNATNVTYLEMNYNGLNKVGPEVFHTFKDLRTLRLNWNNLDQADLAPVVNISSLRVLELQRNNLQTLSSVTFGTPSLLILLLVGNAFRTINFTVFAPLADLRELDISFNTESLRIFTDFMPKLEKLYIQDSSVVNEFIEICRNKSSLFPRLRELILEQNFLKYMRDMCLPRLEILNLKNNRFSRFSAIGFCSYFDRYFIENQSTAEREESNNETTDEQSSGEPAGLRHHSPITVTTSALQTLIFSDNVLYDVDVLHTCTNLTDLDLGNNMLGIYFNFNKYEYPRPYNFLPALTKLRRLILKLNRIRDIDADWFRSLTFLETVDLSNNLLTSLPDGVFDGISKLVSISLKDNAITVVRETTFSGSLLNNLKHFEITNNPFHCSCDLRWFQRWYAQNGERLLFSPHDAECKNLKKTAVMDYYVADQACLLSREASIFIIITVSLLFSLMTLCSWLYRYRWHIRLALFEAFPGRQDRLQRLQNQNFQFDVFVSYASEDLDWVRAHLMPQMEEGMGVRLCVHERIPGKNIVDNISDCVDESKKLMMIFSPHFARSPWCQFELAFCLTHVLEQGDALLVVLLRDVETRDLTPAMMAVMKTMTYIEWEDEDDARDSFWRRILIALREILPGV